MDVRSRYFHKVNAWRPTTRRQCMLGITVLIYSVTSLQHPLHNKLLGPKHKLTTQLLLFKMLTHEDAKRKSTAADHVDAEHPKRARMTEDNSLPEPQELQSESHHAQAVNTAPSIISRPWLTREQKISKQDLWVIHCRDNLVPGALGPKSWTTVGAEFNETFNTKLSYKTLKRRLYDSTKLFYADNPEYLPARVYLVPMPVQEDEKDIAEDNSTVPQLGSVLTPVPHPVVQNSRTRRVKKAANEKQVQPLGDPGTHPGISSLRPVSISDSQYGYIGAWSASSISEHHISAIDRAKYHLRRRTKGRVNFSFLDAWEQELAETDEQFFDHNTLLMASPFYARMAHAGPARVVSVSKNFCLKTVNAFSQIISPVNAKALPTHYLWHSEKPVAGVFDRLGAIEPEKISWTVSSLLELHVFARQMEVWFVCDMVIDRLHWMLSEQTKLRELYQKFHKQGDNFTNQGEMEGVRLPLVPDLDSFSIAAADIEPAWLRLLAEEPVDTRSLTFFRDVIHALSGALETDWLDDTHELVKTSSGMLVCVTI